MVPFIRKRLTDINRPFRLDLATRERPVPVAQIVRANKRVIKIPPCEARSKISTNSCRYCNSHITSNTQKYDTRSRQRIRPRSSNYINIKHFSIGYTHTRTHIHTHDGTHWHRLPPGLPQPGRGRRWACRRRRHRA